MAAEKRVELTWHECNSLLNLLAHCTAQPDLAMAQQADVDQALDAWRRDLQGRLNAISAANAGAPKQHGPGYCEKAPHVGMFGGHLHAEADDGPFTVDGLTYCGRCHWFIGRV